MSTLAPRMNEAREVERVVGVRQSALTRDAFEPPSLFELCKTPCHGTLVDAKVPRQFRDAQVRVFAKFAEDFLRGFPGTKVTIELDRNIFPAIFRCNFIQTTEHLTSPSSGKSWASLARALGARAFEARASLRRNGTYPLWANFFSPQYGVLAIGSEPGWHAKLPVSL